MFNDLIDLAKVILTERINALETAQWSQGKWSDNHYYIVRKSIQSLADKVLLWKEKKKIVTICFETLLTTALLFLNPYWGLLLLLFLFLLVDKIDLLKFFIRINFHKINYYLPILIEYSIILLVNLYLAKRMGIKLSIDLKPDSLLSFLSQRIASIIREELVTSFSWFIISFQVISLHQKSMISQNQIGSITLVLAFLFGLGHLSFFYTHPETFSTHDFPVILAVSIVYNAFCIG